MAAKWGYVTSNFSKIDKPRKGYVTVADIQAYAKAQKAKGKTTTTTPAATAPAN